MASAQKGVRPLIPTSFLNLEVPTQRWYALAVGVMLQAIKVADLLLLSFSSVLPSNMASSTYYMCKWSLIDSIYIVGLPQLRLPKLSFKWQASMLQLLALMTVNYALFGPWMLTSIIYLPVLREWTLDSNFSAVGYYNNIRQMLHPSDGHLQGQHTIMLSPVNTVHLNPHGESFCTAPSIPAVIVPIIFNNSVPSTIRYTHNTIDGTNSRIIQVSTNKLDRSFLSLTEKEEGDDAVASIETDSQYPLIELTQSVRGLQLSATGIYFLESSGDVYVRHSEARVVECPSVTLEGSGEKDMLRCEDEHKEVLLKIKGIPPLSVKYEHHTGSHRSIHAIEGINAAYGSGEDVSEVQFPLIINHAQPGLHVITLRSVVDGLGNNMPLNASVNLRVVKRASYRFRDCWPGKPTSLLHGDAEAAKIHIISEHTDAADGPWTIAIRKEESGVTESLTVPSSHRATVYKPTSPGLYEIAGVQGKVCRGEVLNPSMCRVVQEPLPYVNVSWNKIQECSGNTGVEAVLLFHGTPPFRISYETTHNSRKPIVAEERNIKELRKVLLLKPEKSGSYEYSFKSLGDAYYKDVAIDETTKSVQIVRPLAAASFLGKSKGASNMDLHSCEGSEVGFEIQMKGDPPWSVELQVIAGTSSFILLRNNLTNPRETINVPIPHELEQNGGSFQVELLTIEDSHGCKNSISEPGLSINVRRIKPTAKFYSGESGRTVSLLEGVKARLPLRLTGDGPWRISYSQSAYPQDIKVMTVDSPNALLKVDRPGIYTILDVQDTFCQGTAVPAESTYEVIWIPRPYVSLIPSDTLSLTENGAVPEKRPVCQGVHDFVELQLQGLPPFSISHRISLQKAIGGIENLDAQPLTATERMYRMELVTANPGTVSYSILNVGDASYELNINQPPRSKLHFQQEVLGRPKAFFKIADPITFCLHTYLSTSASDSDAGVIILVGRPPFYIDIAIQSLSTGEKFVGRVQALHHFWRLSLPEFKFTSVGSYSASIVSVKDETHCEQELVTDRDNSIVLMVAETAAITPLEQRTHYCVDDLIRFQLEGTPPWRINYAFNDLKHSKSTASPVLFIPAEREGVFSVSSIAHQSDMCHSTVSDVQYQVRPLPSAKVSHGQRRIDRIREGQQAEIVFELMGEPPFSFTYQRTEPATTGRKHLKVLESHTVTGVFTSTYSIFTTEEGTWTVTSIADKYCRYPRPDV